MRGAPMARNPKMYEVDYSDPFRPVITPATGDGKSLVECVVEVRAHAKRQVQHWQRVGREAFRGASMWKGDA